MAKIGEDIIGTSGLPPFFKLANADAVGIDAPENRKGDALRTWVRSLSGFQKEALVRGPVTPGGWCRTKGPISTAMTRPHVRLPFSRPAWSRAS